MSGRHVQAGKKRRLGISLTSKVVSSQACTAQHATAQLGMNEDFNSCCRRYGIGNRVQTIARYYAQHTVSKDVSSGCGHYFKADPEADAMCRDRYFEDVKTHHQRSPYSLQTSSGWNCSSCGPMLSTSQHIRVLDGNPDIAMGTGCTSLLKDNLDDL